MSIDGWFPRLNTRAQVASGRGTLWVDGEAVFTPGWNPEWMDDETLAFVGPGDRPCSFHLPTRISTELSPTPTRQVSAGGGNWYAAKPGEIGISVDWQSGITAICVEHGGSNTDRSIVYGSHTPAAHQPVQDPRAAEGLVCWVRWTGRDASDREPWAWDGLNSRSLRVFEQSWEASPVPFLTPEGPWLLTQTNWDLRLHPWNSKLGYIIPAGEDQNFNPDVRLIDGLIIVVYNTNSGELRRWETPLSAPRVDVSTPPPEPKPPDPPEQTMDIPREVYDVWKAVADKYFGLHNGTDDERREATRRGISTIRVRCHGSGPLDGQRWVCKNEHSGSWGSQSKDAAAYIAPEFGAVQHGRLSQMYMFDMINGGTRRTNPFPITSKNIEEGNPDAFILVPEDKDWLAEDPVPPTTHRYDGGANDTGTCDVCRKSRFDAIHEVPEGKVPHIYYGGEQDTGLCDICQKPPDDPIHGSQPEPPVDCQEWIDEVVRLENENKELREANAALTAENEALRVEVERLLDRIEELEHGQKPCRCVISGPSWAIRVFGISCRPEV